MGGGGGEAVEGEGFVRMEGRFGGRRGNREEVLAIDAAMVGKISRHSLRVYDRRAISVGSSGRTVSGTAKATFKVGGTYSRCRTDFELDKDFTILVGLVFLSDAVK